MSNLSDLSHELLAKVKAAKIAFFNQTGTEAALYQAAQTYIDHLILRKYLDPKKFKKLHIPDRSKIIRSV